MQIHHVRLLYSRQGQYLVCLTLSNNTGHVERLSDVFSTLRIFFVVKKHKISYIYGFQHLKNMLKVEITSESLSTRPVLLGSVKHT